MEDERIELSNGLLSLIIMVQGYKQHVINEHLFREALGLPSELNWWDATEKYYNSIDGEILTKYELSKNKISFERVISFQVTEEMLTTEQADLHKFKLWFKRARY